MEIQSSYFSYLFVLGLGQSVLLTTAVWKSRQPNALSRSFFLGVLLIMGVELLYGLLYQSQAIFDFPHLLRLNTVLVLAYAPALYLALSYFFRPTQSVSPIRLLHFIPALLAFFYFLPLFVSGEPTKVTYLKIMFEGVHPDSLIFGGLRRLQQGIYAIMMGILLWEQRRQIKALWRQPYFRMLLVITLLFGLMWLGDLYRYFFHFDLHTGIINTIIMSAVLIYLTIRLVINGSFFENSSRTKYASSSLSHEQEEELIRQVKTLFIQNKTYTDPDLTLSALGKQLAVPSNYLSQAINRQLNLGYSNFINQYRVAEAQRLLMDAQNHRLTLLYIGQCAGFRSSSAFNSAFKKVTGQTPSQFRSQHS